MACGGGTWVDEGPAPPFGANERLLYDADSNSAGSEGALLRALSDAAAAPRDKVAALLALREIFPQGLAEALLPPVTQAYEEMQASGARAAVERING